MGRKTQPIKDTKQLLRYLDYLEETDNEMCVLAYIMLYTGFRVGDVSDLTVGEVRGDVLAINEKKTRYLERVHKKDLKAKKRRPRQPKPIRVIPMHKDLKRILKEYTHGKLKSDLLFPSPRNSNESLSYSQINRRLQRAAYAVGIKGFATHALRKTSFYRIYEKNNNIAEVQNFAGHGSSKETALYLGLDDDMRQQSVLEMDNLTELRSKNTFNRK